MRCERCKEEAVVDRNDKSPGTCKSLAAPHVATWPSVAAVNESITSTKVVNSHLLPATTSATAQQQIRVMSGKQLLDQQRNLLLLLEKHLPWERPSSMQRSLLQRPQPLLHLQLRPLHQSKLISLPRKQLRLLQTQRKLRP